MCLLLISYETHPKYKLIIAANRDEFYNRPALPAKFWENNNILAGKDLRAGGTWLGITRTGRFAAITNYRDKEKQKSDAPSRGELVAGFLNSNLSSDEFAASIHDTAGSYNGYNLIFGDKSSLNYFSNKTNKHLRLTPGIYGLSNHLLDTPWPKVEKSKKSFTKILNKENISPEDLFEILSDKSVPPDELLPDTGVGLEIERAVSPVFVSTPMYGTRSSTVIFINRSNALLFMEKSLDTKKEKWITSTYNFEIM